MTIPKEKLETTKRLMGALVRMKPKLHEEMKIGNGTRTSRESAMRKKGDDGMVPAAAPGKRQKKVTSSSA